MDLPSVKSECIKQNSFRPTFLQEEKFRKKRDHHSSIPVPSQVVYKDRWLSRKILELDSQLVMLELIYIFENINYCTVVP